MEEVIVDEPDPILKFPTVCVSVLLSSPFISNKPRVTVNESATVKLVLHDVTFASALVNAPPP